MRYSQDTRSPIKLPKGELFTRVDKITKSIEARRRSSIKLETNSFEDNASYLFSQQKSHIQRINNVIKMVEKRQKQRTDLNTVLRDSMYNDSTISSQSLAQQMVLPQKSKKSRENSNFSSPSVKRVKKFGIKRKNIGCPTISTGQDRPPSQIMDGSIPSLPQSSQQ